MEESPVRQAWDDVSSRRHVHEQWDRLVQAPDHLRVGRLELARPLTVEGLQGRDEVGSPVGRDPPVHLLD